MEAAHRNDPRGFLKVSSRHTGLVHSNTTGRQPSTDAVMCVIEASSRLQLIPQRVPYPGAWQPADDNASGQIVPVNISYYDYSLVHDPTGVEGFNINPNLGCVGVFSVHDTSCFSFYICFAAISSRSADGILYLTKHNWAP
jgi:hypothetical protein